MATSETIRNTLDRLIEQIPLVGGVPGGDYWSKTRGSKPPEQIFEHFLPRGIDFNILPNNPKTARFVLLGVEYAPERYSPGERGKSKTFLRLGFPKDPNGYSSADRSHLSIARLAVQEVFEYYDSLAHAEDLYKINLNNILFFGDGHGPSVWVSLLHKRLTSDTNDRYSFDLNTQDGGFVTYYPDGTLALGGESRHLSPSPAFGGGEREIKAATSAHHNNLELAKRKLEEFLTQNQVERRVILCDYRIVNEQSGYAHVTKQDS